MTGKHATVALAVLAGWLVAGPVLAADTNKQEPAPAPVAGDSDSDDLLLNREQYFYSSFGRRDPFGSLLKGKFAAVENGDLLDVGELTLVGVVWGEEDKFAVVQDSRDHTHVLREGDKVVNGRVLTITQNSVTVQHFFFGETANVTITMNEGAGSHDAQ